MAAPNFPLSYGPIFPVERTTQPRINVSTFGDGYIERSGDGINTQQPETDVVWEGLTQVEMQSTLAFFSAQGGIAPFMWTYPGDTVPTQWVCDKWVDRFIGPGNYGINAHFQRDFNPA